MGLQNLDAQAVGIAVTGMVIVFAALVLVSCFIAALPRVLTLVNQVFPIPPSHHHAVAKKEAPSRPELDDAVIAAIGYALHLKQSKST